MIDQSKSTELREDALDIDASPATPERPQKTVGRPKSRSSEETRERILNEAERLFAERGYDGTSVRNVASAAGLQLQAIGYHFGPKESLFETVVERRAVVLNAMREDALATLREEHGQAPLPLDDLVRAYSRPFIASANSDDEGWRNFAALMGRLANSRLGTATITRHYNVIAKAYIAELKKSLPDAPEQSIVDGMLFFVASMLSICAATGRFSDLSGSAGERPMEEAYEDLVTFTVAGLEGLAMERS
ncbi:TetR/AcrR family transcriptional regulator [Thalassococcus sp. S3]|uniref:TetR/AcrR family transcriptional regulator n=1 Tax=Thalassococcus sp. S3 TaxID=2017482 RepID=UPI0010241A30|nr:TetR/AcrR family transcriptional regulator [Thalassococcus sp. S3]QBF30808.1 hypothetical protein CFI11_06195 [Thalassococcus sp. S3]